MTNEEIFMTNIYQFGNTFEWNCLAGEYLYEYGEDKIVVLKVGNDKSVQMSKEDFKDEAKLTGLSFENFLEMAREKGEQVYYNDKGAGFPEQITVVHTYFSTLDNGDNWRFRRKDNEPFSALLLRIAKERKYL